MFKVIEGKVSLIQYFIVMLVSTVCMVSVVIGAYVLPHDKNMIAMVMMILSTVSIVSSAIVINMTLPNKDCD